MLACESTSAAVPRCSAARTNISMNQQKPRTRSDWRCTTRRRDLGNVYRLEREMVCSGRGGWRAMYDGVVNTSGLSQICEESFRALVGRPQAVPVQVRAETGPGFKRWRTRGVRRAGPTDVRMGSLQRKYRIGNDLERLDTRCLGCSEHGQTSRCGSSAPSVQCDGLLDAARREEKLWMQIRQLLIRADICNFSVYLLLHHEGEISLNLDRFTEKLAPGAEGRY